MTDISKLIPRIYVASLSDYSAGRLHGVWIDCAGKTEDALWDEVRAMLAASRSNRLAMRGSAARHTFLKR